MVISSNVPVGGWYRAALILTFHRIVNLFPCSSNMYSFFCLPPIFHFVQSGAWFKTKPYSTETPALFYWLWALCEATDENKHIGEEVNTNAALKQFAQEDAGFQQYTERYKEISDDMHVRRMYNMWTEEINKRSRRIAFLCIRTY